MNVTRSIWSDFGFARVLRALGSVRHLCAALAILTSCTASLAMQADGPKRTPKSESEATYPLPDFPIRTVHAIVCGVSDYESNSGYRSLDAAETDARRMARLFEHVYGFETTLLLDEEATRDGIYEAIQSVRAVSPNDAILFYFAGHGETLESDGNRFGFLVPYGTSRDEVFELAKLIHTGRQDADGETPEGEFEGSNAEIEGSTDPVELTADSVHETGAAEDASDADVSRSSVRAAEERTIRDPEWLSERFIRVDSLRQTLNKTEARHVVLILDSCFSGAALNLDLNLPVSRGVGDQRDNSRFRLLRDGSRVVMSAGMADEQVWETSADEDDRSHPWLSDSSRHGVYTREVVVALSEPDQLAISTGELFDRVYDGVTTWGEANEKRFTPQRRMLSDHGGDFVFVKNPTLPWLEEVRRLREEIAREERGGATDPRSGDGENRRRPLSDVEIRRADQARANAKLEEMQPHLDYMVVAQQIRFSDRVDENSQKFREQRWHDWARRNEKLSAQGHPVATASMALAYQHGVGVDPDPRRARVWASESRDTGSLQGKLTHQILQGVDAEQAIKQILEKEDLESTQATVAAAAATGVVAGALSESDEAGVFAGLFVGTAIVLTELMREPTMAELAQGLIKERNAFFEHSRPGARRQPPERTKAVERWLNNAQRLRTIIVEQGEDETTLSQLGPIICDRLATAVHTIKRNRPSLARAGRPPQYATVDEAIVDADRYTDELVALIAEFEQLKAQNH